MDTIHTLNTSLPTSVSRSQDMPRSNHQRQQPPHTGISNNNNKAPPPNLHAAFKAAAFSVAQMYKTAATDADASRAEGYQDAIDELLVFLDQENLGLGDGEGWRVRQWATERLEPSIYAAATSDADDESVKDDQNQTQRPEAEGGRNSNTQDATTSKQEQQQQHRESSPPETFMHSSTTTSPTSTDGGASASQSTERRNIFHFAANSNMHDTNMNMTHDDNISAPYNFTSNHSLPGKSPASLRVNLRPNRTGGSGRSGHMASMSLGSLGLGSGSKRKTPPSFADIFDFAAFGGGNGGGNGGGGFGGGGGGGGGKRGRME